MRRGDSHRERRGAGHRARHRDPLGEWVVRQNPCIRVAWPSPSASIALCGRSLSDRFQSFNRDGELRIDFTGRQKQFVVELRAEEERRAHKRIEFWTNRLEQARALRCEQRTKSANHIQAGCLSRPPCWKVVENDPVGPVISLL